MHGRPTDDQGTAAGAGVRRLILDYADALTSVDVVRLRSLWDDAQPGPFLVIDELHDPVLSWPDLEHQFHRLRARQRHVTVEALDFHIRLVSATTAIAYVVLAWSYLTVESDNARTSTSRLLAVAHQTAGGLRLTSLMDAPLYIPERD